MIRMQGNEGKKRFLSFDIKRKKYDAAFFKGKLTKVNKISATSLLKVIYYLNTNNEVKVYVP